MWGPHIRRFAPTVLVSHAVTLAVAIALAVIIGIGETFTAVPAMVGSFWMVVNLAPVQFAGAELGIVPVLPAALVVLVHSRRIRAACGSSITVRNIRVFATLAVVVPVILTCLAWLVLWDASHVFAVAPPNIFLALLTTALLNGFTFVLGLGPKIWRALLLRRGLPTWPVESARLAGTFLRWLLTAGLVAVVVQLLLNVSVAVDAYSIAPDAWGKIGLTVLSVLYLPNLAVGGAAVLAGSEMHIGEASASLFAVTNANLPPLPVLAAMPNSPLPFGEALLVVPAVIALVMVYRYVRARSFVEAPVFTGVGAGVFAGGVGLLLALAAGGRLGVFDTAGPLVWLTPLVFGCWILVPALLVFAWMARQGSRVTETAADPEAEYEESYGDAEDAADAEDAGADEEPEEAEESEDSEAPEEPEEPEDTDDAETGEEPGTEPEADNSEADSAEDDGSGPAEDDGDDIGDDAEADDEADEGTPADETGDDDGEQTK